MGDGDLDREFHRIVAPLLNAWTRRGRQPRPCRALLIAVLLPAASAAVVAALVALVLHLLD